MIPGDIGDVPTLACLNKPQKRALILRDQLRYLEPAHLDTFLDGVTADEPPTYKNVNGTVYPPLAQVTIKEDAARFDLGNVQFPEEGGTTYRAYLTVEDERFEMRTEDALPKDDAELGSVGIHRFVAENMFPLFKTKYKAIHARMEKINEARRVAYNMLDHPPAKFEEGETLARLHSAKPKANEESSRDGSSRKRKEVAKHISNKRQRIGLETIPDNVKSETFNTIPAQIKVDLFNNIVKTAFPNFDNLIVASWNVVSVYANVGSDFPELHKAVVELKGALEEFETAYAPPRIKSGKGRKEATPNQQSGVNESRTATPVPAANKEVKCAPVPAAESNMATTPPPQEGNDTTNERYRDDENDVQHQMPPPRMLQASQQHKDEGTKNDEHQPSMATNHTRAHSVPRYVPESNSPTSNLTPRSRPPSPVEHPLQPPRERVRRSRDRSADSRTSPAPYQHLQAPGAHLMRKRQEYASSLTKPNRSSTGPALGHHAQDDEDDEQYEQDQDHHANPYQLRRQTPGAGLINGSFLGTSVLGAKRPTGAAPVAPMLHTRKDGGGGVHGGNGTRRHGY